MSAAFQSITGEKEELLNTVLFAIGTGVQLERIKPVPNNCVAHRWRARALITETQVAVGCGTTPLDAINDAYRTAVEAPLS